MEMPSARCTVPAGLPASPCRTVRPGHQLPDDELRMFLRCEVCLFCYIPGAPVGIHADLFFRKSENLVARCAEFFIFALVMLTLITLYLVV